MAGLAGGRPFSASGGAASWSPARLRAILIAVAATTSVVLGGLGYAVYLAATGDDASALASHAQTTPRESVPSIQVGDATRRDQIAAEPMLRVPEEAALPTVAVGHRVPPIRVPAAAGVTGPAFVMTGFPRTPEGAIGQLAQIDIAVLQSLSTTTAEEVHQAWALPGGVSADRWWITASLRAFLTSAGMGQAVHPSVSLTVEPAAALVTGTDGSDWATVCVLLKVTATYKQEGQVAFAHCERMQWVGGRWMLGPGPPPAPAPATWPGSRLAVAAGWAAWTTEAGGNP